MFTHETTNLVRRPLLRLLLLVVQAYKGCPLLIICVNASSPHWTQSRVKKGGLLLQYTQTLIAFLLAHLSCSFTSVVAVAVVAVGLRLLPFSCR